MSRDIDSGLATALAAGGITIVLLAEMDFDSGTVRMWTGIGTLEYNGNSYTGIGNLGGISACQETQDMQAQGLTLTLSGVPSELVSLAFEEEYQSRPCRLSLAEFLSAGDGGSPERFISGVYQFFAGLMDVMQINDDGKTCSITLNAENVLFLLTRNKVRYYTSQDQKTLYPDDTGLDYIAGLQDAQIIW